MSKELFEEIINDIVHVHRGDKNTPITIIHSNGQVIRTQYQYLILDDDYLKVNREIDDKVEAITSYILYSSITAVQS